MPEISRFFGIVIRMYVEAGEGHHRPHFHAYHQNSSGVIAVDEIEVIGGDLGVKQVRLVLAWAELHQAALLENWDMLQAGLPARPIEPLR
jgi:hypothetical protein